MNNVPRPGHFENPYSWEGTSVTLILPKICIVTDSKLYSWIWIAAVHIPLASKKESGIKLDWNILRVIGMKTFEHPVYYCTWFLLKLPSIIVYQKQTFQRPFLEPFHVTLLLVSNFNYRTLKTWFLNNTKIQTLASNQLQSWVEPKNRINVHLCT